MALVVKSELEVDYSLLSNDGSHLDNCGKFYFMNSYVSSLKMTRTNPTAEAEKESIAKS